ncbi:MAG: TolC family protein, partial [Kiritimatiellia bacterium]
AALVNRKEMWAGDLNVQLRKVEALAALAHFLPTLSVSGGGAYSSNDFLTPHKYLTGGVGGVMYLFDGLQSISDYMTARENGRAAYDLREDSASTLMVSVWQAWTNWRQARDRVEVAESSKRAAEIDYDETYERYKNDQETLSDVLDKFSAREQARIDALSAGYADALSEYVFRDTVGLGWGEEVPAATPVSSVTTVVE